MDDIDNAMNDGDDDDDDGHDAAAFSSLRHGSARSLWNDHKHEGEFARLGR